MEATFRLPWMDEASSFINLMVRLTRCQCQATTAFLQSLAVAYGDAVQPPFQSLGTKAFSLDMPPQGNKALGSDVDVCIGLNSASALGFSEISHGPIPRLYRAP